MTMWCRNSWQVRWKKWPRSRLSCPWRDFASEAFPKWVTWVHSCPFTQGNPLKPSPLCQKAPRRWIGHGRISRTSSPIGNWGRISQPHTKGEEEWQSPYPADRERQEVSAVLGAIIHTTNPKELEKGLWLKGQTEQIRPKRLNLKFGAKQISYTNQFLLNVLTYAFIVFTVRKLHCKNKTKLNNRDNLCCVDCLFLCLII